MSAGMITPLSREVIQEICGHIRTGVSAKDACLLSMVHESTFYKWKASGEKIRETVGDDQEAIGNLTQREALLLEFVESIKVSRAGFKSERLKRIQKAGETSWQADAWLLERIFPDEFANRHKIAHSGKVESENRNTNLNVNVEAEATGEGAVNGKATINLNKMNMEDVLALEGIIERSHQNDGLAESGPSSEEHTGA